QIHEAETAVHVAFRDADHEPQVRADHVLAGVRVARADLVRELDLLSRRQEVDFIDLAQIDVERYLGAHLTVLPRRSPGWPGRDPLGPALRALSGALVPRCAPRSRGRAPASRSGCT